MQATSSGTPIGLPVAHPETLQALLDVSLTGLIVLRPLYGPDTAELTDFAIEYLNPAGQQMLSQPKQPVKPFLALFPHARENGAFAFCRGVFETGEPGRFEVNYQADGLDNYFYLAARRQGEQLTASFTDTASQTRTAVELALRASQAAESGARQEAEQQRQRFQDVLAGMPAQVAAYHGPDHVFTFVNPRYQCYFPGQALLGRPLNEVLPEAEEQGILTWLDGVYHTGKPYHAETVEVWLDFAGTRPRQQVYLDLFFCPLRDVQGRITGVLDFSYDVTEQVRVREQVQLLAEQLRILNQALEERIEARTLALRTHANEDRYVHVDAEQQRASLARFLSQTKAAICILRGPAHVLDYCNPTFERLFAGRSLPAGSSLAEVFPQTAAQGLVYALDGVFTTGTSYFEVERELIIVPSADQPARPHYFTFSCDAYQEHDRTVGVSFFAYDVTEQVLARSQAQALHLERDQTSQQLLRSNIDLDTFIYTASHDLRTPIANIEGLLTILRKQLPAEVLQTELVGSLLDRMQKAVERFQRTIAQLTDVAKLQQIHDQPAEAVDLVALVDDLRLDLVSELAPVGAALTVEVAMCSAVSFAPQNLRSIVYNLLSNALKYRHPTRPPLVALRCRRTRGTVVLEVQDNGLGLTMDQQSQLFGLFRRLHDHVPGTGIGLYIVKRLVENAGGTITVQSQVDEGTTFIITLPDKK